MGGSECSLRIGQEERECGDLAIVAVRLLRFSWDQDFQCAMH